MANSHQFTSSAWAPFRIEPWFSPRIWGCRDLRPWYDNVVAEGDEPIGEAWLTGDQCVVSSGDHTGRALGALFAENPEALLGPAASGGNAPGGGGSPLLIKVIFPQEKLSVQVHPDDKMAQKLGEPRGKTECWYVLEAKPGAQTDTLESSLNALDVARGEMIFVDAGTVHAIWPGAILLETQQNCDLTYRMYDYGRGRELHLEKSLEAARFVTHAGKISPRQMPGRSILMNGKYFCVERISVAGARSSASLAHLVLPHEDTAAAGLAYLFAAEGTARVAGPDFEAVKIQKGGMLAVPAASPKFVVENLGDLELMRITPRWPATNR
jgi:mannose-6-phosphate isomerase